ncbi:MAG: MlaD family protein [Pseudonocardia sp.]
MITRTVWLQLTAFALVALLGVTYVGFRYAGFADLFGSSTYPVRMQMTDSGGIFTGADVTYRGVSVGSVGPLRLTADGVEVTLDVRKSAPAVPADVDAQVRNLSAIGEQFVDLVPASDGEPFLAAGSVIPTSRVAVPVPIQDLVSSVDALASSVPQDSLRTVVDELGTAFDGSALPLQKIIDTTDTFTAAAIEALPPTLTLIRDGRVVLATQNDVAGSFRNISADLKLVAEQLERSDPDIRRLFETGPAAGYELSKLLRASGDDLGKLVANLLTISRIQEPRQDGLRQVLVTYPALSAAVPTLAPGDGTAHLGLVLTNENNPPACRAGYEDTVHRPGVDVTNVPVNEDAFCAEPPGSPTNVRGAQNVSGAATPMAAGLQQGADANAAANPAAELLGAPLGSEAPMGSPADILAG